MTFRTSLAVNVAPLCLRLVLALTFIWAGFGKVAYRTTISDPAQIAKLVEWGQAKPESAALPAPPLENPETAPPTLDPEPAVIPDPEPEPDPVMAPPTDPEPPVTEPVEDDPKPITPVEDETEPEDGAATPVSFRQVNPNSVEVKRVMGLALLIDASANPGVDDQGRSLRPLWPAALANGSIPVVTAWVAAILELVCGAAMLIGFFTRLAALPLAGTMLTAMWLTQIGPAIQRGDALYGFLPQGVFDIGVGGYVYADILWQFALMMVALAVFLMGPGFLSIDRLIFGSPGLRREEYGARQVEFVPMSE